jgi:hypothetical protein
VGYKSEDVRTELQPSQTLGIIQQLKEPYSMLVLLCLAKTGVNAPGIMLSSSVNCEDPQADHSAVVMRERHSYSSR